MNEPFLTYRFQGFRFIFGPRDEVTIVNERNLPWVTRYKLIITGDEFPFTIQKEEEKFIMEEDK